MGKRELIALLNLSSWCLVMVERPFLAMPWGCLQFVIVVFPDHTHSLFLSKLSHSNDKHRYLLCIIDVFSKYAWVVPIKDQTGKTLVIAFKSVLKSGRFLKSLQTDKGTEFKNKEFQNLLKTKKIHFFTSENPRTLKTRMWKYFTHYRTLRYQDILPKLLHGYNHAYHRSIKFAPVSVTLKNETQVSENLYGKSSSKKVKPKFKVGVFVRINYNKVSKGAKIRNRYNQVPTPTQDTNGKVTNSQ